MNQVLFQEACNKILDNVREENGIGTLGEKTVHAVLKNYLVPDTSCHEIKIDHYFADIVHKNEIIEIQTRSFDKLRKKLDCFLALQPVTIVYPIPYQKWLRWINQETGEISKPRKSPKLGTAYMIFSELYKIKQYLLNPNLNLQIIFLNIEEYRFLDGWSTDKKKGSTRCDRIPMELVNEVLIRELEDYKKLIPPELDETFTVKEFQKVSKLSRNNSNIALNVLFHVGAVKRIGKKGRAYLYER